MKKSEKKIFESLKKIFPKSQIPKKISKLKIGDFPQWDSLGNFNLLLEIEKQFSCRINTKSFNKIKSVKDIREFLKKSGNYTNKI
tara:strand:+ start:1439 stop:1693 length:255 start_codon:yes stop_codon:yes gene_type:complete